MELQYRSSYGRLQDPYESVKLGGDYLWWTIPESETTLQKNSMISACVMDYRGLLAEDIAWANIATMAMPTCFTTTSNLAATEQLDSFGELKGKMTSCRPSICARRYENVSIGSNGKKVATTTDTPLTPTKYNHDGYDTDTVISLTSSDNSNCTFSYQAIVTEVMWSQFWQIIEAKTFQMQLGQWQPRANDEWTDLWERLSEVLT
jgi:hypothetical protein